jgi:hypothetical protein
MLLPSWVFPNDGLAGFWVSIDPRSARIQRDLTVKRL